MKEAIIFTDGASRGNPGAGGWGAVIAVSYKLSDASFDSAERDIQIIELGGSEKMSTNNRMELKAAIESLRHLESSKLQALSYKLYSDSKYLINGITKWVFGWQKSGWKTKTKEAVLNKDLWEKLLHVTDGKKIEWKYLGGHVGITGNERADEIATDCADGKKVQLYSGSLTHYGKDILNFKHDENLAKEKTASRSHSSAKAYSYLSLVDGKLERHKTWAECESLVKGKKAKFRKAISVEDENAILKEWGIK